MITHTKRNHRSTRRRPSSRRGAVAARASESVAPVVQPAAPTLARPVLVATDGSRVAGAAIAVARLMAANGAWAPEAVTVLEPLPVSMADVALGTPTLAYQRDITDSVLGAVRAQLRRAGAGGWNLAVQFGRIAHSIARLARDERRELIVLGLGHHGRLARLAGAETAARVVRLSDMPVLAVAEGTRSLPFTVLVAMDFGDSSVRAAREALALLQPPGRLHLLHVRWAPQGRALTDPVWERTYADGVERGFKRLREQLSVPPGIQVTSEVRFGLVVETLLTSARKIGADVIAVGSHSQTVLDRLIIGSTPAQLLRAAECSVLVAPPLPDAGPG